MRNFLVLFMGFIGLLGFAPFGWSAETPDTILIRKTLGDEATGWRAGNVPQIVSQYASPFTGYESYGSPDPKGWRVRFGDLKEFEAFCKEALSKTRYDISRTPLYFDIRAVEKDRAIVVAEEAGVKIARKEGGQKPESQKPEARGRKAEQLASGIPASGTLGAGGEGGRKTALSDTTQLWMLRKVDEEWKITGFVRLMDEAKHAGASDKGAVEKVIQKEMEGWNASEAGKIVSLVAPHFTGYEAYGKADLKTWKVTFRDPDEWKAFCKKRLSRTTYALSRKVLSTDVRGDKALAVVEESSATTHRETGGTLASSHRDLWMLAKVGGGWRITGFIKRFEWME